MPRERKRRKQAGRHSGVGSLAWDKSKGRWRIRQYIVQPDGSVSRPSIAIPDEYQTAEGAKAYLAKLARDEQEKVALRRMGITRDVAGLVKAFCDGARSSVTNDGDWSLYTATGRQWVNMQGRVLLADYSGRHLRAFRDALDTLAAKEKVGKTVTTRGGVNKKLYAIRRIVKWGISAGQCAPDLLEVIRSVEPLRQGQAAAREGTGREACGAADFDAALPFICEPFNFAAILQRWGGGARPTEILSLRVREIDLAALCARKVNHKTKAKTGIVREIFFTPTDAVKEALAELLKRTKPGENDYLFRPGAWGMLDRGQKHPDHSTYRKALNEACGMARDAGRACEDFTPYQICHLRLEEIEAAMGPEHAQATRQHSAATMTAQYTKRTKAERTRQLAQEAAMVGVED